MLIYNFKKEFLGIDEKDLKQLGFNNLAELKSEVSDFSDLFVKTPGYIHNFKHVHWIDFIACAESNEESKVIMNVNSKNYKSIITITSAFLVDNPSEKAYLVHLNNIRELSKKESENVSGDILDRPTPKVAPEPRQIFNEPEFNETQTTDNVSIALDPYETSADEEINISIESANAKNNQFETQNYLDAEKDDLKLDINFDEPLNIDYEDDNSEDEEIAIPKVTTIITTANENFDNGYIYNPRVASEELGLPVDLIEEFIEDFIGQAKDFKKDLYRSFEDGDLNNLKILSHKLKGVAANLRIEDAFETLNEINASSDLNVIKENLDTLYKIIAKLSGEKILVEKSIEVEEDLSDETPLDFKDETIEAEDEEEDLYSDPIEIEDSQVPQKIEIAELADDMFVSEDEITLAIEENEDALLDFDEEIQEKEIFASSNELNTEYSKEAIANEIGLDKESFDELFEEYVEDSNHLVQEMEDSIKDENYETCQYIALKLKGMSENMRINSLLDELNIIIGSSNKNEMTKAINIIKTEITQISKLRV